MKNPPQRAVPMPAKLNPSSRFALTNFDQLPDGAFVPIPVLTWLGLGSPATIWRKVKKSEFPAPVKVSTRRTAWQVGAIRQYLADLAAHGGAQ